MQLSPLADRARLLFYMQAFGRLFFFWLPASLMGGVALAFVLPGIWAAVTAIGWFFLMFLVALWWPTLAFERWGYLLRDEELVIGRGVLFRSVTAIPTHRIQHVDIRQGPFEQWLGLGRVQVYTASGVGADGVVPGLLIDDAQALRDTLVKQEEGESGV